MDEDLDAKAEDSGKTDYAFGIDSGSRSQPGRQTASGLRSAVSVSLGRRGVNFLLLGYAAGVP
jgi:hypothetical protein